MLSTQVMPPEKNKPQSELEVSVIVPAYNSGKYIAETLKSIQNQLIKKLQIIVINDCSTDETEEIVKEIAKQDSRILLVSTEKNMGGPSAPRNIGVSFATANWIAFCDADDLWAPYKLKVQLEAAKNYNADFICCGMKNFSVGNASDHFAGEKVPQINTVKELTYLKTFIKNRIATSSVLCRRDLLKECGKFNEAKILSGVEDYDMWLRVFELKKYKIIKIDSKMVRYRIHSQSLSSCKWNHVKKVLYAQYKSAQRCQWDFMYMALFPIFFSLYALTAVYIRLICKKI